MRIEGRITGKLVRTQNDPDPKMQRGRNHDWLCVKGPPEFSGNLFRTIDIQEGGFPLGTTFQNIKRPTEIFTIQGQKR